MQKEVIILGTMLEAGYWQNRKRASYHREKQVPHLDLSAVRSSIPLAAIAVHFGVKDGSDLAELPFCYFRVTGLREDGERVIFDYELLSEGKSNWRSLRDCLQPKPSHIVETRGPNEVLRCLKSIGEEPPDEWLSLLSTVRSNSGRFGETSINARVDAWS